jgi:hypothetical protein
MPGRLRIRVRERTGDQAYFEELARSLGQLTRVSSVRVDPRTGSVLIHHKGSFEAVVADVAAAGLLEVVGGPPDPDVLQAVRGRVDELEGEVRSRTRGAVGLDALSFYALLGGTLYRFFNGPVLPAGMTLFIQAAKIVAGATPSRRPAP